MPGRAATMPAVVYTPPQNAEPALAGTDYPAPTMASLHGAEFPQRVAPVVDPKRRSSLPFIAVGIIILLLVLGVGGYAVMHLMSGSTANGNANGGDHNSGSSASNSTDMATRGHEVTPHWPPKETPPQHKSLPAR